MRVLVPAGRHVVATSWPGPPLRLVPFRTRATWLLVAATVLVQIAYPLISDGSRTTVTVLSVVLFATASLGDCARLHGYASAVALATVAGGGGWLAEAVGLHTGYPFGEYHYTGTLGPELLGVPLVVPLAWTMMAWPALVVGRTLATRPVTVIFLAAAALSVWDVFLDAQMVAAGHWYWADPEPGLPFVDGVPLTNYGGWILVSLVIACGLHLGLGHPSGDRRTRSGPAATLYLWTFGSSVLAHLAFFDLPGSALMGGLLMGAVAVPYGSALAIRRFRRPDRLTRARRTTGVEVRAGGSGRLGPS